MRGESIDTATFGWFGVDGDRRLGPRRAADRGGFPWLTAGKLPELLTYEPVRNDTEALPSHVRTPTGDELELFSDRLAEEIAAKHGTPVEMTHLDRGIFDEASLSLIGTATVEAAARLSGHAPDVRRFRPNLLIETDAPYVEDAWVGRTLAVGSARIGLTNRDERCAMVNYDPDSAASSPEILKCVVRERQNLLGVYGTVLQRGVLAVGQELLLLS